MAAECTDRFSVTNSRVRELNQKVNHYTGEVVLDTYLEKRVISVILPLPGTPETPGSLKLSINSPIVVITRVAFPGDSTIFISVN